MTSGSKSDLTGEAIVVRTHRTGLRWMWLSAAVLVLDQGTKYLAVSMLHLHEPLMILPHLNLTLTYNPGAAFSFLSDGSGWQRWFFTAVAALVSGLLVVWLRRLESPRWRQPVALSLILGGAVGNLWDRILLGHVVDFIDLYYGSWHWPAFNVADSAISIGAALLIFDALLGGRVRGTTSAGEDGI